MTDHDRNGASSRNWLLWLPVACVVLLLGCDLPGTPRTDPTDPADPTPPSKPDPGGITLALSDLTPGPAQGKVALIDYDGPSFDKDQLRVAIGDDAVETVFLNDQLGLLLPLTHHGPTTLTFIFGEGRSSTLVLNISLAPTIADPRRYVSDELAGLTTGFARLVASDGAFQGAYDALVEVQSGLADLNEREVNELAIFFKQNIEPALASVSGSANDNGLLAASSRSECSSSLLRFVQSVVGTAAGAAVVALAPATGPLSTAGVLVGSAAFYYSAKVAASSFPEVYEKCTQVALSGIRLRDEDHYLLRTQTSSLPTLSFDDGRSTNLTVTLSRTVLSEYRVRLINNVAKMRSVISLVKRTAGKITTRFDVALDTLMEQFPQTLERTETATASGFTLKSISDSNIAGEIVSAEGTTLALRFQFSDRSSVQDEYVDFDFTLASRSEGLDDTIIPARLHAISCAEDLDTLLAAKHQLRGDAALNWDTGLDPALWEGVSLSEEGCVTSIWFSAHSGHGHSDKELTGWLPPSLGNLSRLEQLVIGFGRLTGSIPSSLGNLSSLKHLYLTGNRLSGSIPSSLGNLSDLEQMHLSHNRLSGSIPSSLGNLSNLRILELQSNRLSGSIPSSLGSLHSTTIKLLFNRLTGCIPRGVFDSDYINPQGSYGDTDSYYNLGPCG